jgi:serine/threonine-protein kinase RIM15
MSSDIFDLDEEREEAQRSEQTIDASSRTAQSTSSQSSSPSTSQLRVATNPTLLSPLPQPFAPPNLPQHRKHAGSFAATPSFPSPLAQAITVPPHSDTSSSSSRSGSEDEEVKEARKKRAHVGSKGRETPRKGFELRSRTASPKGKDLTPSPSSTEKSVSRPTSPARLQPVGPSSLLTKSRGNNLPPIATASASTSPRTSPTSRKSSPTHTRRLTDVSKEYAHNYPNAGRQRSGSHSSSLNVPLSTSSQAGSSPLAFGSPELEPIDDEMLARSSRASTGSPQDPSKDSTNILGLGLGGNWGTSSTASGSSRGGSIKGKSKDTAPSSPRRDRLSIGGMPISR